MLKLVFFLLLVYMIYDFSKRGPEGLTGYIIAFVVGICTGLSKIVK